MTPTKLFHEACIHGNGAPISHKNREIWGWHKFDDNSHKNKFFHFNLIFVEREHMNQFFIEV